MSENDLDNQIYEGYTRKQLKSTFDLVCNKVNWKLPIDAQVHVANLSLVCISIAFFVGGFPEITKGTVSFYRVRSNGYYNIIGA